MLHVTINQSGFLQGKWSSKQISQYKLPQQTAECVIDVVWNKMNSRDVRDLLKIAKIVRKNDLPLDIEKLIQVQLKYAADKDEEEESEFN